MYPHQVPPRQSYYKSWACITFISSLTENTGLHKHNVVDVVFLHPSTVNKIVLHNTLLYLPHLPNLFQPHQRLPLETVVLDEMTRLSPLASSPHL